MAGYKDGAKAVKSKLPAMQCDWLVFDISNMLFRTFFVARNGEDDVTLAGLATHSALVTLNKYYKQFKPKKGVVMAFDRSSWRKEYTASDDCHPATKPYKGNRRKDMSPAQQAKYAKFIDHLREFENLIIEHTAIVSLVQDRLEADDLIAGFCQINDGDDIIIISADSDLLQLKKHKGIRVVSPANDKEQQLEEFDNDPLFYVFQKCMRGDPTDNIQSAYPRLRKTKIREAYDDPYIRANLMKETWTDEKNQEILVEDMFKENQRLIDLEKQPKDIRIAILTTVDEALNKDRKFSMFHLLKFCSKYDLVKIKDSIDTFIPMLS
jgi:5'-3' exonuclease